jgi:hypothetical protein
VPHPPEYVLTIDLNALNHLGINLYSNIPAVVSEVVANSWDADAEEVKIDIDKSKRTVTVTDDGYGMTQGDINEKFLKVGYSKRDIEGTITAKWRRHVMGRKGIGKLSLFSIANIIEVHSVKKDAKGIVHKNGFVMDAKVITKMIKAGKGMATYNPKPIDKSKIKIEKGTKIILRDLKKGVSTAEAFIRTRLARRFSIIGSEYNFSVIVNTKPITIADRDYFRKIEYLWHIGTGSEKYKGYCTNLSKDMKLDGIIDKSKGYKVTGWIGTFDEQKSIEEGNNTIVIQAWGKLIHEDILKDMKEGGLFTKYLIGEVRADFLDKDDQEDIATSDRQRLRENDPRYKKLKAYIQNEVLKLVQSKWTDWRNEGAEKKALKNPKIEEWFKGLSTDNKKYARQLFGKIESFPVADPDFKRELYKQSILAFETLALKGNLSAFEQISSEDDLKLFTSIFSGMDELERVHYYQILKGRLAILKKFENLVPKAKETLIQKHLFNHLWLLDSSWERASTDAKMETTVVKAWKGVYATLTPEQKRGRLDIKYRTAAGKHIIIELKKYNRPTETNDLLVQIRKYRSAVLKVLKAKFPNEQHLVECVCILGEAPRPQDEERQNRDMFAAINARFKTYDELIQDSRNSYRDYLDKEKELTKIQALIESI